MSVNVSVVDMKALSPKYTAAPILMLVKLLSVTEIVWSIVAPETWKPAKTTEELLIEL